MNEASVSQFLFEGGAGLSVTPALLGPVEADGLVWHPLLYFGEFEHPRSGEFTVDDNLCEKLIASFNAGFPTSNGIPIDEDNLHRQRGEGAFGWIKALEIRDGQLCGGIQWTNAGKDEIENERLPFVSPTWYSGAEVNSSYPGVLHLIFGGALVTRPFFYQQPMAEVASAYAVIELGPKQNTRTHATGGIVMDEARVRELIQAKYGDMTDEDWAEASKDIGEEEADWEGFLLDYSGPVEEDQEEDTGEQDTGEAEKAATEATAALEAQKAELQKQMTAKDAEIEAAKAEANTEKEASAALGLRVEKLEADRLEIETRATIQATAFGKALPTPSAVDVLTAVAVDPCEANVKGLLDHLTEHNGSLSLIEPGEKGALIQASATNDGEEWLKNKGFAEDTNEAIRALVEGDAKDLAAMQAAEKKHWESKGK